MGNTKKFLVNRRRTDFFVFRRRIAFQFFCDECRTEREFVSLADAVSLADIKMRDIVRRVESGELHFLETANGHLFVCRQSLSEMADATEKHSDKEKKLR